MLSNFIGGLPPEAIKQFQEIYKEEFGEEISEDEARTIGKRLINLIKLLRQRPPQKPSPTPEG